MSGEYTDLPDYQAFETSMNVDVNAHVATNIRGAYGDYIFFDLGVYARATPEEQARTEEILLERAGEKSPQAREGMQTLLDTSKEGATLQGAGGGTVIQNLGISVMDDRTVSLGNRIDSVYGRAMPAPPQAQQDLYLEYTRHHENAHLMLNLKEPASDFMASVALLRQHPEARETLQTIADLRLVDGFKDGPGNLARYGAESYEAIQRALSMTPEQIQNTPTETLHAIALEYDEKNQLNRTLMEESPEGKVLSALDNRITGGANKSALITSWEVAAAHDYESPSDAETRRQAQYSPAAIRDALRQSNLTGEERGLANETINAINRLDSVVGAQPQTAPASRPALSGSM